MKRRTILRLTGISLTAGLAGCSDDSGGSEPEETDTAEPTETATETATETVSSDAADLEAAVEALWDAYNEEDATGVVEAFHPDSPSRPSESELTFQGEVTLGEFTVNSQSEDSATIQGEATLSDGSQEDTVTYEYELRTHEGEWDIYDLSLVDTGTSEPATPQVAFDFAYDVTATSSGESGVLTITHEGGDNVDAANLSIRGTGIVDVADVDVTETDTVWANGAQVEQVSAGSSITVGATTDCDIRLVWESGDTSATLATYQGPDA